MRLSDSGPAKTIRCAIYTRKSTEDGLDQAFNSLDAQREACAAYVTSQRHEGCTLQGDSYDDGGFSGGSMERHGLKRLMEKGHYYPGEHQPIIDKPLFDAVQAIRAGNSHPHRVTCARYHRRHS